MRERYFYDGSSRITGASGARRKSPTIGEKKKKIVRGITKQLREEHTKAKSTAVCPTNYRTGGGAYHENCVCACVCLCVVGLAALVRACGVCLWGVVCVEAGTTENISDEDGATHPTRHKGKKLFRLVVWGSAKAPSSSRDCLLHTSTDAAAVWVLFVCCALSLAACACKKKQRLNIEKFSL